MTFVQNFWNRWNTNHLAFVREMRKNITDMFVNDEDKVRKCYTEADRCKDRDRYAYWDRQCARAKRNRSSHSVSTKRSSRSGCRILAPVEDYTSVGGIPIGSKSRIFINCGSERVPNDKCEAKWSCMNWLEFLIVTLFALLLLIGIPAATIYWVITYQGGVAFPSAQAEEKLLFNFHALMMVTGFICLSGLAIISFRLCRCCRRCCPKMLHFLLHLIGWIVGGIGAWTIYTAHENSKIPHLYSIHSLIGVLALGLFALQFVFGFFCYPILLLCDTETAYCRSALLTVHSGAGLGAYITAICACLAAVCERAFTLLGADHKKKLSEQSTEGSILFGLGAALPLLAFFITYICMRETFRNCLCLRCITRKGG